MKIQRSVRMALLEMDSDIVFYDDEIQSLKELIEILQPSKFAVEALCRRDATILTAERINMVVLNTLQKSIEKHPNNNLAREFHDSLK